MSCACTASGRILLKRLCCVALSLAATIVVLLLAELAVRCAMPQVNLQDTQRSLLRDRAYGQSVGWQPDVQGISFGQVVQIDAQGFRDLSGPKHADRSWILLGDSIAFGVGVNAEATFAGLLQARFPRVAIRNTAVIGYNVENYRDVLRSLLAAGKPPDHVLLFYCLNDIYGYFNRLPEDDSAWQKCLGLLRRNSKLYVVAKDVLTDRSKSYFTYDRVFYSDNQAVERAVDMLDEIHRMTSKAGSDLTVVIMPYEYQIRNPEPASLEPQRVLRRQLEAKHIAYLDALDWFRNSGQDSRAFYLYGDPMHLSRQGHTTLFEHLIDALPFTHGTKGTGP